MPKHMEPWLTAYSQAAQRWSRLADIVVDQATKGDADGLRSAADVLSIALLQEQTALAQRVLAEQAETDPDAVAWAQQVFGHLFARMGIEGVAPAQPVFPVPAQPAEPGPVVAHLGEIVHYQSREGRPCLAAITVRPGTHPTLQVFLQTGPYLALEVRHWEEGPAPDDPRWHCACECGQVQAVYPVPAAEPADP